MSHIYKDLDDPETLEDTEMEPFFKINTPNKIMIKLFFLRRKSKYAHFIWQVLVYDESEHGTAFFEVQSFARSIVFNFFILHDSVLVSVL